MTDARGRVERLYDSVSLAAEVARDEMFRFRTLLADGCSDDHAEHARDLTVAELRALHATTEHVITMLAMADIEALRS